MIDDNQKYDLFRRLHRRGEPLALYNIWDAGTASAVAASGAAAVATGSASMSWAHGYTDSETLPLEDLVRTVRQIVRVVDAPRVGRHRERVRVRPE